MKKSRLALFNTIANIVLTLVNLMVNFLVTRIVLSNFGSDYNGLNTTINQIIAVMLVVESGFALSANVALYRPIFETNKKKIESILSAVNYVFLWVGFIFLILGLVFSFLSPLLIKTSVGYWEVFFLFLLTFLPIGFRLIVSVKYTTFLESAQKNYLVNFTKIFSSVLILLSTYLLSVLNQPYFMLKFSYFIWNILSVLLIVVIFKKLYKDYKISINKNLEDIKGVKDVLLKKIASVISSTYPALILGFLIGTEVVSVYGVYMLVVNGLTSLIDAIVTGPKDSLGVLVSEKNMDKTYNIFSKYSFLVIAISTVLFSSAVVLILPFIKLYTKGVADITYINPTFAVLILLASFVGAIQGPYTHVLNSASIFKAPKNSQVLGAIVLVVIGIPLVLFYELNGLAIAILVHNLIVTISKMWITHHSFFKSKMVDLLKYFSFIVLPQCFFAGSFIYFSFIDSLIFSYFSFFYIGLICFVTSVILLIICTFKVFKTEYQYLINFFKRRIKA